MRRLAYLLASCVLVAGVAQARKIDDRVSYELTVTDAAGQPVDGARVWTLGDSLARTDLRAADLARLVGRYGRDVDFIFNGDLHPHLEVRLTDAQGKVHLDYRASEVAGLRKLHRHFAVFKRGFVTAQLSDETPNNSERKIPVQLVPDAQAKIGERLLELDRLHSRARTIANGKVNLDMAAALKAVSAEVRALAEDLEKRKLNEEAAVAYALLANLPSVDTGKDSEGRPIIIGVTNYFRTSSPARVASPLVPLDEPCQGRVVRALLGWAASTPNATSSSQARSITREDRIPRARSRRAAAPRVIGRPAAPSKR